MSNFSNWFDQTSGYALHRIRFFPLSGCCKDAQTDGRYVIIPQASKEPLALPLYRCPTCKKYYAEGAQGFAPIENPLRYQIRNK